MVELYPHQIDAARKMHNGCILCGRVGSGKSRTGIAYYFVTNGGSLKYRTLPAGARDLYIITTAKKRDDHEWLSDLVPFNLVPDENGVTFYGNRVIIDSWNNIKKYSNVHCAFFIFDEQRVVGYGAWTKAFLRITNRNQWILMSATPGDKWEDYIPVFIANHFYKNKSEFMRMHAVMKPYVHYPIIDHYIGESHLIKLREKLLVDIDYSSHIRRHNEDRWCDWDEDLYKQVWRTRFNPETMQPFMNASGMTYFLRKIVNSDPSRVTAMKEILEVHPKAIVFYSFDYELEILHKLCCEIDMPFAEWNGHYHAVLPTGDRWLYLVNYLGGSDGWNCITTDTMIFYSLNYSYKTMEQAAGRIDRANSPFDETYYFYLRSRAPIDKRITNALRNKKNFNERDYVPREWFQK